MEEMSMLDSAVQQGISVLVYADGYREYSARDLEGGLWSFMKRIGP